MWPWQRKSGRKQAALWTKLASISLSAHLLFAGWFFLLEHQGGVHLHFALSARRNSVPGAVCSLVELVPPKPKPAAVAKVAPAKKAPTTVAAKKTEQAKPVAKKEPVKTAQPKKVPEKPAQQLAQKKDEPKKTVPTPMKKEAPLKTAQAQATLQKIAEVNAPASFDSDLARGEVLATQLQQAVASHWAPPPGVDEACVCSLAFYVDWDGNIQEVVVCESSGVLMYDVAARCALTSSKLPAWARGKNLTIAFKQ